MNLKLTALLLLLALLSSAQTTVDNKEDEQLLIFAEGLFQRTWYKDAVQEYEKFLTNFPQSDKAQSVRWRLYECFAKLNDTQNMLSALEAFIVNEPDPVRQERARMNKAKILSTNNKYQEALAIYQTINRDTDDGSLWESANYEAAGIFLKQGQDGEAFLRFRQLAALDYDGTKPIRAYAIFSLATSLSQKKQLQEAIEQYKRLVLTKGTPADILENSWYNLGVIYFTIDQYAAAQQAFMAIVNNFPQGPYRQSAINQAARSSIQQADYPRALEILNLSGPASAKITLERNYLKGFVYWKLKQYDAALELFDTCINHQLDDYKQDAARDKISCLHDMGQSAAVLENAAAYLQNDQNSPFKADINYIAGQNAAKLARYATAGKYFRAALDAAAEEWPLLDNAYFALADTLYKASEFSATAEVWEELFTRQRSQHRDSALLNASQAWIAAQKPARALQVLNRYLAEFPQKEEIHQVRNRIVEIYLSEGQFKEAAIFLEKLLKTNLKPEHKAQLQLFLGKTYYHQKSYSQSADVLENCLQIDNISDQIRLDCLVYLGFAKISLGREHEGVKSLATAFGRHHDLKPLLGLEQQQSVALLLEKYNYSEAARGIYTRLTKADNQKIKIAGMMGIARLALHSDKPDTGLHYLKQILQLSSEEDLLQRVEALSIMGEIYYKTAKNEQALQTFDFALKMKTGSKKSICRSLYGMALIFADNKDFDQARRYANRVFILYDDQHYSPRAMFLSLQCSWRTSKKKEASQTARELKKRFPIYFAKIEVQDYLKEHGINTD